LAFTDPELDANFLSVANSSRLGEPEDHAKMVVFLASDDAAWVNGVVIPVDGGSTCSLPYAPFLRQYVQRRRGGA
jgi:NAD(P)-dependent dehydrogenase (short-subunit alcohol dehydrogenase family)